MPKKSEIMENISEVFKNHDGGEFLYNLEREVLALVDQVKEEGDDSDDIIVEIITTGKENQYRFSNFKISKRCERILVAPSESIAKFFGTEVWGFGIIRDGKVCQINCEFLGFSEGNLIG